MPDDPEPRVLVRPVVIDAAATGDAAPATWPHVALDHGESPAAAALRAVAEAGGPAVTVGLPVAVTHGDGAGVDTLVIDLSVRVVAADAAPPASVPRPQHDPPPGSVRFRRLAAYAVIVVDERILLTQLSTRTPAPGRWTLPGGGIDPGESPVDAVVREVHEETGHVLRAPRLLDVDSTAFAGRSPSGRLEDFHGVGVIYRGDVVRVVPPHVLDVGGSTADAAWVPLADLPALPMSPRSRDRLRRVLDLAGYGGREV